jgi:membrane protein YqaA with SNARE-associated domain
MLTLTAYAGLFTSAVAAASLLPLQSEAVLIALLLTDQYPVWLLVLIASVGNTLGSLINWALGRYIERFRNKSWFPVSEEQLHKAQAFYHRYGRWSLLLSWVPLIGDPLTLVAGLMRERIVPFLLLVSVAKTARYVVLALLTLGMT